MSVSFDLFRNYIGDKFSYNASKLIFDYLEDIESDGYEIILEHLDFGEFTEYSSYKDLLSDFQDFELIEDLDETWKEEIINRIREKYIILYSPKTDVIVHIY